VFEHHRGSELHFLALEDVQVGDFAQGLLEQGASLGLTADCDGFDASHIACAVYTVFPLDRVYLQLCPFRQWNFCTVLELTHFAHVPVTVFFAPLIVMAVTVRADVFAAAITVARQI